jgi:hypothetical protein
MDDRRRQLSAAHVKLRKYKTGSQKQQAVAGN